MSLIKLNFSLICDVPHESVDELGRDIAHDLLCEMFNGEDALDWEYTGYEVVL